MDETTPHLHLSLVPIKDGRLAAKNLFTKSELRELQTAFVEDVGATYGLQRGLEGSNRGHLTELQFKIRSSEKALEKASERVSELAKEARVQEAMASEAEKRLSKARNEAAGVNTEYLAKRAYLAACDASSAVSVMYPDYAVVKKASLARKLSPFPRRNGKNGMSLRMRKALCVGLYGSLKVLWTISGSEPPANTLLTWRSRSRS